MFEHVGLLRQVSTPLFNTPLPAPGFPSLKNRAPDLLQQVSLQCLCAQLSQPTELLEEDPGTLPFILFHPSLQGWTPGTMLCSMLVLPEFTSEMLNCPSPGWGPAGLRDRPPWSDSSDVLTGKLSRVKGLGGRR